MPNEGQNIVVYHISSSSEREKQWKDKVPTQHTTGRINFKDLYKGLSVSGPACQKLKIVSLSLQQVKSWTYWKIINSS